MRLDTFVGCVVAIVVVLRAALLFAQLGPPSGPLTVAADGTVSRQFGSQVMTASAPRVVLITATATTGEPLVETQPMSLPEAIAAGHKDIVVTESGTLTDTLVIPGGVSIRCDPGVEIRFEFGVKQNGIVFSGQNSFQGCRVLYDGGGSEVPITAAGPHGMSVYGGRSIRVDDVYVRWPVGDGLYIGSREGQPSSDVVVAGSTFANNGRHGATVTSGDGVTFDGCKFLNNKSAGLDIEPNSSKDSAVVTVNDCDSEGNGSYAYSVQVASLTGDSKPVNIKATNARIKNSHAVNRPLLFNGFQPLRSDGSPDTPAPGCVSWNGTIFYGESESE